MSCHWLRKTSLVLAMLAGATAVVAEELGSEEIETEVLDAEEASQIASGWVSQIGVTGERSIRLTGDRDKVHQAIGAVIFADRRAAQGPSPKEEQPKYVTRVFRVQHADPKGLETLIKRTGPEVQADSTLRVVVLSGRVEQVETAEAVLAKLDIPPKAPVSRDVVLNAYLIGAYLEAHESSAVPTVLEPTVAGIRESFPFASYRLLQALVIRTTPGGRDAQVKGYLPTDPLVEYRFQTRVQVDQTRTDEIRIEQVQLTFRTLDKEEGVRESEIWTALTTRVAKTVVVGKAGIRGVADGVFLVLNGRFD